MVLALVLNIVLCAFFIVAVATPLAGTIRPSLPDPPAALRRRHTAWSSAPSASRIRTPALSGSER